MPGTKTRFPLTSRPQNGQWERLSPQHVDQPAAELRGAAVPEDMLKYLAAQNKALRLLGFHGNRELSVFICLTIVCKFYFYPVCAPLTEKENKPQSPSFYLLTSPCTQTPSTADRSEKSPVLTLLQEEC